MLVLKMDLRTSTGFYILSLYFVFFTRANPRKIIAPVENNGNAIVMTEPPLAGPMVNREEPPLIEPSRYDDVIAALALTDQDEDGLGNDEDVIFHLFTKRNPTESQVLEIGLSESLKSSNFQAGVLTVFVTHGYLVSSDSSSVALIRDAFLTGTEEVNVVAVNWSGYSRSLYRRSARNVEVIGTEVARMINFLRNEGGLRLDLTTLVGHSLGAHVMGVAGRQVTGGMVNQVFGLDPAAPRFKERNNTVRISQSSGRNVQIIHTNAGNLGLMESLGHADFYPNGGSRQPGCGPQDLVSAGSCSHGQSYRFFAESLNSPIGFKARRCSEGQNPVEAECTGEIALMGGRSNQITTTGRYYLMTHDEPPYAIDVHTRR